MPYTINRTNGERITVVNDGTINTTSLDITLIGKNYTGYGEAFNENFVKLLENFSNTARPTKPLTGQLYFNSTTKKLEVYTTTGATKWKTLGVMDVGNSKPAGANAGDLWFNPNEAGGRLYAYSGIGAEWVLVGPINTRGVASGAVPLEIVNQDTSLPESVLKLVANGSTSFIASTRPSFDVAASEVDILADFSTIKQGITLPDTDSDGVSYDPSLQNGYLMWGTAGTALGLVRSNGNYINADAYLTQSELSTAVGTITINQDDGLLIGTSGILKLHVTPPDNTANISVVTGNAATLRFNVWNGTNQFYNIYSITTGTNNDPRILPNSTATVYIGTATQRFSFGFINTITSITANITTVAATDVNSTRVVATSITTPNLTATNVSSSIITVSDLNSTRIVCPTITATNFTSTNITAAVVRSGEVYDTNSRVITAATIASNAVTSLTGTANKVSVNQSQGAVTVTLPNTLDITVQSLRSTGSSQVFGAWTLASGATFQATYADLAERYHADAEYESGTVLIIGGPNEVTTTSVRANTSVAGIVSTNPAYTLNAQAGDDKTHPYIALKGRVPCKVVGPISKGDLLVTSRVPGYAVKANDDDHPNAVLGRALQDFMGTQGVIEVMVI